MSLDTLHPIADRSALYAAFRREEFTALLGSLGEHRWDVDLPAGTVTFSSLADPARRLVAPAELVATISPADRSILWGWAHPQGQPDGPVAALRARGQIDGIAVLASEHVPFPADAERRMDEYVSDAAFIVGLVATEITGRAPAFIAPLENGTQAVFLLNAGLPPLTVARALSALPQVLATLPLRDGRTAAWGLARLAGWRFEWSDAAYSAALVADDTGTARFSFDESARIVGFSPAASDPLAGTGPTLKG